MIKNDRFHAENPKNQFLEIDFFSGRMTQNDRFWPKTSNFMPSWFFSEIIIFTLKITIFMMIFEIQFHGFIGVVSTKNSNFENFRKFSNRENNVKFRI